MYGVFLLQPKLTQASPLNYYLGTMKRLLCACIYIANSMLVIFAETAPSFQTSQLGEIPVSLC